MDIRTQSILLASIVGLSLGLSMLLRPGRARVLTRFSVLALVVGGYYLAQFTHDLVSLPSEYPILDRTALGATLILGALVPSAALSFFLDFLGVSPSALRNGGRVALLSGVLGLAVGLTPLAEQRWARAALAVWVVIALTVSVSLIYRRMRRSESRTERARLMYLVIGAAATLFFTVLDLGAVSGLPVPTLGPVFCTLYLFFLAQTLLRSRLLDLHELLGKVAATTVLATILAAVFVTLTVWIDTNVPLFVFNTLVAAFVTLILLEPLRVKVEDQVVAIFFRERFALMKSLSALRNRIVNVIDIQDATGLVLDSINDTRRVTHASVYLLAEDRPGFRLLDSRGPPPTPFLDAAAARGLLNASAGGQKAVLLENLERRIVELRSHHLLEGKRARDELKRLNDTRAALIQMKAGISVPLVGNDRVIGFLNLWDERVPEAYASDEIALILNIAERMATTIENSKLYEKMRERDRLAALGEMSAGLAHEIRNPLGAIKGAAQCLDPKRLPGEDGEFLEVIVEEVNRLNGVVTAFLDYARPLKQSFGPTDANEVITRTTRLIQNEIPGHIELKVELSEPVPKFQGDAEQIKQVLINLIQNAIQAMGNVPGRIIIRSLPNDRFADFRSSEHLEIHVIDNGPGIPTNEQQNIFVPFYTTKEKGTGLGLAICQRIVKNHGGAISVVSRVGEGTTFVIRLPAMPAEPPLALPQGSLTPSSALSTEKAPAASSETKTPERPRRARKNRARSAS